MRSNVFHEFLKSDYGKWKDIGHFYELIGGEYREMTFGEIISDVNYLANYLISEGYRGKNIGVYSPNSSAWMIIDVTVMTYVGMTVGISKDWTGEDLAYAVGRSDVSLLFYSNRLRDNVDKIRGRFPDVRFISIEDSFEEILARGRDMTDELFSIEPKDPDLPAKMVFTSGTTSYPKGVMLSVGNMFASYEGLALRADLDTNDRCYLFLPLHHTYATVYNYLYSFVFGYSIWLCSDIHDMAHEMSLCRPTAFCAVPVIFERFLEASRKTGIPLRTLLGGQMRYLFSGGAALPVELRRAYTDAGMCMMNSYGLSETASAFSIDYPDRYLPEGSGVVMEYIDAKVKEPDEDGYGELALRSPNVFLGYYKDPEATAAAFDSDGYFLTGDIGTIRDGMAIVRGRKDTMLTLSNGENISSSRLISKIREMSPDILSVRLSVRDGELHADINIDPGSGIDMDELMTRLNGDLPKYERIRHYNITRKFNETK